MPYYVKKCHLKRFLRKDTTKKARTLLGVGFFKI